MVKGTVRQTVTLDYIIGRLASNGLKGIKPRTLIILRMGLFAIRGMDSVPDHAAVNEAVSLARKTARGTDRFINAVLRSYLRRRDEFENQDAGKAADSSDASVYSGSADRIQNLSVKYSMPADLTGLICEQYGEDAESVLKGLNEPPEMVLRVNTLKNTRENLIDALRQEGISAEAAPASVRAVIAKGSHIIGSDLYRKGMFTVQSLSSIMSIEAFSPAPGSKVLDMCAAPGGKSTMMAEIMGNQGSITACDIHEHRLELIKASAARTGAEIIETKLADGTVHESALDGTFDYVLADVPCSGLGVMSTKPEIRLRTDVSQFAELTDIQLEILKNAFRYTKPGGRICYSTCTLNKAENEAVIEAFRESDPAFGRIVEMQTVLPYNNLIGFYYCIIEKSLQ
jgi:16S rRNA (cytosine967-C5)-methyltransferase